MIYGQPKGKGCPNAKRLMIHQLCKLSFATLISFTLAVGVLEGLIFTFLTLRLFFCLFFKVIFFTDPVDEYLMQYLMDYEDKKFQNVSKEGLNIGKDSKGKELKETFKELTKWWKDALSAENVDSVKISNRLDNTPCIVVTSKYGWSANMEKIMQSQTLSDASKQAYMRGKRVLEINPRHPIIKELRERVASNPEVPSYIIEENLLSRSLF